MKIVIHVLSIPAQVVANAIHSAVPHLKISKKATQCLVGLSISMSGVVIAHVYPHVVVDFFCWGAHSLGLSPVLRAANETKLVKKTFEALGIDIIEPTSRLTAPIWAP